MTTVETARAVSMERPSSQGSPRLFMLPFHGTGEDAQPSRAPAVAAAASNHSNDESASSIDHVVDKKPTEAITRRQKAKRHCAKFKWWYLAGLLIFLVIFLPILFKVIIPAIVQKIVNNQSLPVEGGVIRAVSPNELFVTLKTSLDTPLPATINPFELSLYNRDSDDPSPFVQIQLPEAKVNHNTTVTVEEQTVNVLNENQLVWWFSNIFDQAETELSLSGDPKVSLGALNYEPKMDLTVKVPALNRLHGFTVEKLEFTGGQDGSSNNIKGKLNLPNAGVLTLGLGNLTLNIISGDITLGVVNVYNVELKPGNNTSDFDGEIYLDQLIPNLGALLDSQKDALTVGAIDLTVTGNSTIVNGQHIKYVESVLNKKTISTRIPILTLAGDILSGILSSDSQSSLVNVIGNVFGNSSLLESTWSHWSKDQTGDSSESQSTKTKRDAPRFSLVKNLVRMSVRASLKSSIR
ncbi:unnamed protein product [Clonostachys rosea f. rosea IK726]|uniref:Uncharacterized protein n=2 Tax=Clonostachys rosea f. rosea IK726 TaxID=1349383 RepID=A0ACA9TY77_BIOOC|nr:unnamed protein product [Clonostachys rosea f. rosea IK726]